MLNLSQFEDYSFFMMLSFLVLSIAVVWRFGRRSLTRETELWIRLKKDHGEF